MQGETSAGIGALTRPAVSKAASLAKADKVKAVKLSVKVKVKKKVKG